MNFSSESFCLMMTVNSPSFFLTDTVLSSLSWYGFMSIVVHRLLVDDKRIDVDSDPAARANANWVKTLVFYRSDDAIFSTWRHCWCKHTTAGHRMSDWNEVSKILPQYPMIVPTPCDIGFRSCHGEWRVNALTIMTSRRAISMRTSTVISCCTISRFAAVIVNVARARARQQVSKISPQKNRSKKCWCSCLGRMTQLCWVSKVAQLSYITTTTAYFTISLAT